MILKLNGRSYFIDRDSVTVAKVSNGRYAVTLDGHETFTVVGGYASGGARHEWFCHNPALFGEQWVPTKSMIEAIRLGASY